MFLVVWQQKRIETKVSARDVAVKSRKSRQSRLCASPQWLADTQDRWQALIFALLSHSF